MATLGWRSMYFLLATNVTLMLFVVLAGGSATSTSNRDEGTAVFDVRFAGCEEVDGYSGDGSCEKEIFPEGASSDNVDQEALSMFQRKRGYRVGAARHGHDSSTSLDLLSSGTDGRDIHQTSATQTFTSIRCFEQVPSRRQFQFDLFGAIGWEWPKNGRPLWIYVMAAVYSLLPAVVAYGLVLVVGGCGSIQLISTIAYWVVVQPAARAMESLWQFHLGCPGGSSAHRVFISHATAAHFYWTWAMLEISTRQRPLWQRLAMVVALSACMLPVPLAQIVMRERSAEQVAVGSLLGNQLGVGFFFGLRFTGVWTSLKAMRWESGHDGIFSHWTSPRDNLTTFWGGSVWPQPVSDVAWRKV